MSNVRRSILFIGLPILAILIWFMWFAKPIDQLNPIVVSDNSVPVHIAKAIEQDVPLRIQGLGQVQPWHTVTVRSRVDGRLDEVYFTEGQQVEKGQLLAKLDDRVQQANLAEAKAKLARNSTLLENAKKDLARYEQLAKHMAIEKQALDTQKAEVAILQSALLADQASITLAETELDYTSITAPITGRTGALLIDPGNQLRTNDDGAVIVKINQIDPIAVSFTVPDVFFSQVQKAASNNTALVQVFDRAAQAMLAEGELVLMDNQIDPSSATLRLKAKFDNTESNLWPGLSVDVRLILGSIENALVVPEGAVQRGADGLYVYVVQDDSTVSVQSVKTMMVQDGQAIIIDGLTMGQDVVTDGHYKLRPGAKVTEAA